MPWVRLLKRYIMKDIAIKHEWKETEISAFWNFFNQSAYRREMFFSKHYGRGLINYVSKFEKISGKILDYGCGSGVFLQLLNQKFGSSVNLEGIDFQDDYEETKHNGVFKINMIKQPHLNLPYEDEYFDIVFMIEVLEHLLPDRISLILNNLYRIIKPKGRLIISVPNNEILEKSYKLCPNCNHYFHQTQHLHEFDRFTLKKVVELSAFKENNISTTSLSYFKNRQNQIKYFINKLLNRKIDQPHLIGVFEK